VLNSSAEGSGFKSQPRRCRVSLRQTFHTQRASVHQAAKLVAALFTARCYASAVLAMAQCPSVRPFVCLSVTSRSSTKTAKRRITQTTPHDSPGTLVFEAKDFREIRPGSPSYGGAKCRWDGSKSATFDK